MKMGPKMGGRGEKRHALFRIFFATLSFMCRFSPRPPILGAIWLTLGSLLPPFGSLLASAGSLLAPFWLPLDPFWLTFCVLWLTFGSCWLPFDSLWTLLAHFWCPLAHFWCPFLHFCSLRDQSSHFCCILSSFFVYIWINLSRKP